MIITGNIPMTKKDIVEYIVGKLDEQYEILEEVMTKDNTVTFADKFVAQGAIAAYTDIARKLDSSFDYKRKNDVEDIPDEFELKGHTYKKDISDITMDNVHRGYMIIYYDVDEPRVPARVDNGYSCCLSTFGYTKKEAIQSMRTTLQNLNI